MNGHDVLPAADAVRVLARDGWVRFAPDPATRAWAEAALPEARAEIEAGPWRHGGTWFPGVDALPNAADGSIRGVPLAGPGPDAARAIYGGEPDWHRAQISACRPGYPGQDAGESDAAHRFRKVRDAAHVDGLLRIGPDARRMLGEPHAFVLGLPLAGSGPSPLVLWDGSHRIIGAALGAVLGAHPVADWPEVDLTEAYQSARRHCFEACRRVEVSAPPGASYITHRLTLHGVGPWVGPAEAPRVVAYLRPELRDWRRWIDTP